MPTERRGIAEKLASRGAEERELTPREREVLLMLAQGHNNKTMARALQISVRTVETHRLSIRRKLDIDRPADLMKHAMVHGWLPGEHWRYLQDFSPLEPIGF